MKRYVSFSAIIMMVLFLIVSKSYAMPTFITIATGDVTGVYFPTGSAIALILNKQKEKTGIRAVIEATDGSVYNINSILNGKYEFGLAQSDRQYQAVNGLKEWENAGPQKNLRSVFSIYPESITLVTGGDLGIKSINDLKGRKVSIGNYGSGQRQNAIDILTAAGIDYLKQMKTQSLSNTEANNLLQSSQIDAYFYTIGHPSQFIKKATTGKRKVVILNIVGKEEFFKIFPYYSQSVIPMKYYSEALNTTNVKTFGVKATLVTSVNVPDDIVYVLTKALFENFEEFKRFHPAYDNLTKKGMLQGLSAPIHPGALKYYKEVGLL